jgi:hypothetical protein
VSKDGGKTWDEALNLIEGDVPVWEPFLFALSNDTMACAYSSELPEQKGESSGECLHID